jgi:hypothetical protein
MAKKTEEGVEKAEIASLDMNLYRDDLNAVVAKVNELVDAINAL